MIYTNRNILFFLTLLTLCVLSLVWMFIFALYGLNGKHTVVKTFSDFGQALCKFKLQHRKPVGKYRRCPESGIVTIKEFGRLGNQIWEYVTVRALARKTGLEPYIPQCIRMNLDLVFESLSMPTLEEIDHCPFNISRFVSMHEWRNTDQSLILKKYTFAPIVITVIKDVIKEFRLRQKLILESKQILLKACKSIQSCTFVGIHIRRTDYMGYLIGRHAIKPAGMEFYMNSMKHYQKKFKNVVFVVVSDDPIWCQERFGHMNNVYVASKIVPNDAALDLAILASCNHTIFDYGSFGTWGAILAGGETIYFDLNHHSSARVGKFLSKWHTL